MKSLIFLSDVNKGLNLKKKYCKSLNFYLNFSLFIITCLTFFSCATSEQYPQKWGTYLNAYNYGDTVITGNYSSNGIRVSDSKAKISILELIRFPKNFNYNYNIDNFILNLYNKDSLKITLRLKTDTIYKTVFPNNGKDFSLTEDGLELECQGFATGDRETLLTITNGGTTNIMKGRDGSLIIMATKYLCGIDFSIIIPLPAYGSSSIRVKFLPYDVKK